MRKRQTHEQARREARACMGSVKLYSVTAVHPIGKDPLGTDCATCREAFGEPPQSMVDAWTLKQARE